MSFEHDEEICNESGNRPFQDVLNTNVKRRKVLQGGLVTASAMFFAGGTGCAVAKGFKNIQSPLMDFAPVPNAEGNGPIPSISADYQYDVIIPWGEPLQPGGPAYNYPPSAAEQELQIGIGHDGMHFFPIREESLPRNGWDQDLWDDRKDWYYNTQWGANGNDRGMLCINHEFGDNSTVLGKSTPESLDDVRASQHAHGASVVALEKVNGSWQTAASPNARRIHVNTEVEFSGPVAGHALLENTANNVPMGTVNNCANGYTPWGTYLTCEENFNGYFGATGDWTATEEQQRYGFSSGGFGYGWELFDERFDMSNPGYANECNRFGWIVEIDPFDGSKKPVKRTALGRVKHEGIAITVGRGGRVVGYMGDDQRFDYIYKFVSDANWRSMRAKGQSPLDHGKLYVAKFNDDGTGEWLELTIDNAVLAQRFNDQAEVLTFARVAADLLGATPMDRPEWTTVAPNDWVYCTLTNNSQRTEADAANPMAPNADGHIIRWKDSDQHVGTDFIWEIFLVAKDTHGSEQSYSDPDGLMVDPDGRLFIQTDGGQKDGLNNQLLVANTKTGELRRLFTGVTSDEVTGITMTPDRRTMFVNLQHPGNGNPNLTNFPAAQDGVTVPRDCTIVITRKDGGIIGS